jgi:outer membrane protein OmpA-like peptidoglycan-associated protein
MLLGGLLLASLLAFYTETGRQLRQDLVDRLAWIESYLARHGIILPPHQPESTAVPPTVAEEPGTGTGGNIDEQSHLDPAEMIVPNKESSSPPDAPPPEPVTVTTAGDQSALVSDAGFAAIAPELTQKGFDITKLDDGSLKVGLSTVGMFEFNSTRLNENAAAQLASLAEVLNRHEAAEVHVVGHTDSLGEPEYNLYLSRQRAQAVADYLVERGLQETRIRSEGRGDLDTRHETATQDQPDLRRRVEVFIKPIGETS